MALDKSFLKSSIGTIKSGWKDIRWNNVFSLENAFPNILRIIIGILIIIIGHTAGSAAYRAVLRTGRDLRDQKGNRIQTSVDEKVVDKNGAHQDNTELKNRGVVVMMSARLVYWIIVIVSIIVVLGTFGVQIASMIAVISTLAILVGLSLQGTLSDIASGVLLAFFQTYEIGDVVRIEGVEGRVIDFRLVNTLIEDLESRSLITVPNHKVQSTHVENLSQHRFHRFKFEVRVSNKMSLKNGDQISYEEIVNLIVKELSNKKKYPFIVRHDSEKVRVLSGVSSMKETGTIVLILVPLITGPDLLVQRGTVMTGVRDALTRAGVQLVDHDYTYISPSNGYTGDDADE